MGQRRYRPPPVGRGRGLRHTLTGERTDPRGAARRDGRETGMVTQTATADRPATNAASVWRGERRTLTVGLLLSMTAVGFEAMAVATVLPAIAADLGGVRLYGWTFSAFMLANLASTIVAGQAADRRGPALPYA